MGRWATVWGLGAVGVAGLACAGGPVTEEVSTAVAPTVEVPTEPVAPQEVSRPDDLVDAAAVIAALQGAWVVPGSALGLREAWEVTGDAVRVDDGSRVRTLALSVVAPCALKLSDAASGSSTTVKFGLDGDGWRTGLGGIGVPVAGGVVFCVSGVVVYADHGACRAWRSRFGRWEETFDVDCAVDGDTARADGHTLQRQGAVFLDRQMAGQARAASFPTFADAQAARP